jgi:CRP-like cAMP-binding protein
LTADDQREKDFETFLARRGPAARAAADRREGECMSTLSEAHAVISRSGWLSFVPPPFRQVVLDRCVLQDFEDGATIYSVGDPPGGMYGLIRGNLALSIAPGERGPYIAHFARPGTWFGEAAAFTEQPRRIGLAVTRDSKLLHLPLPAIREIVTANPGAWRFFGLAAIAHIDVAIGAADDLLIRDHVKRSVDRPIAHVFRQAQLKQRHLDRGANLLKRRLNSSLGQKL